MALGRRPKPDPIPSAPASNSRPYESVWDYPRPPRVEPEPRTVRVTLNGEPVAESSAALRVLETAGAPTVYLPPEDLAADVVTPADGSSFCEWKGAASYYDVRTETQHAPRAAWAYLDPTGGYGQLAGYVSFYPALLECFLDDERVEPQPGGFYGGWVTAEILGPIKGGPGSAGW